MIVVEGPDGSGKTTLVKQLCQDYDLRVGERGTRDRDKLYTTTRADTWRAFAFEMRADSPPLIWDRLGPWSDPIYAPLAGRATAFSQHELEFADNFVKQLQCLLIVCLPELEIVEANVRKAHQMEGVIDNISLIYREYRRLGLHRQVPIRYYNYARPTDQLHLKNRIRSYFEDREEREHFARSH